MGELRRLLAEETARSAVHGLRDDAVLSQLADRVARGELVISRLKPEERPGPPEGGKGEAAATAAVAAVTKKAEELATITNPLWSVKRVEVGGEVEATFTYSGFVADKSVKVTFFECDAKGARTKVEEKTVQVSGESGDHKLKWKRSPDAAQADLEEDEAEGDSGPVEYRFVAESKKAGSTGESGPLWLTNTVTIKLTDDKGKALESPRVVVLKDFEKEQRAKADKGEAKFEKVLVGPIKVRLAEPTFTSLAWSKPKVGVGKPVDAVFKYEDAIEGMKVSVVIYEFNADGTMTEVEKIEVTLDKASGEAKASFTRTEDEAQEDMAADEREGDTGPLEYRYLVTTEGTLGSKISAPLMLTHTVSVKLENAADGKPFPDGMELVLFGADGAEHRAKLGGGEAKFEEVVCGPMTLKLVPKKGKG